MQAGVITPDQARSVLGAATSYARFVIAPKHGSVCVGCQCNDFCLHVAHLPGLFLHTYAGCRLHPSHPSVIVSNLGKRSATKTSAMATKLTTVLFLYMAFSAALPALGTWSQLTACTYALHGTAHQQTDRPDVSLSWLLDYPHTTQLSRNGFRNRIPTPLKLAFAAFAAFASWQLAGLVGLQHAASLQRIWSELKCSNMLLDCREPTWHSRIQSRVQPYARTGIQFLHLL